MTLRAAVVGCGRIGCGFDEEPQRGRVSTHARAYVESRDIDLVALVDLDPAKLERFSERFDVGGRYTDYEIMLRTEQPDLLSICTLSNSHLEIARAGVTHGVRGILCEKPIADSLSAADAMIALCAEMGVALLVGHQRRFDPLHLQASAYVRDGHLGRVQQVTAYYTAGVANTGTHLFDLLRLYLGDATWVQGRFSSNGAPNGDDPNIDGWIGFECGCVAALQACDVRAYLLFEVHIIGEFGRLSLVNSGMDVVFQEIKDSNRFAGYRELVSAEPPVSIHSTRELLVNAVAHLVECLEKGREPISGGRDGRAALEIVQALQASASLDSRRVDLPFSAETNSKKSR